MSSNNEKFSHEARPDGHNHGEGEGSLIRINVSHDSSHHELHVPAHSTFGYIKKVIEQQMGLDSEKQKILFRGKEKEDGENLQEAGVKDKSKILVLEEAARKGKKLEETKEREETSEAPVKETEEEEEKSRMELKRDEEEVSKAFQAIAETRAEIDKLAERVAALEVVVNGGTKVSEDEFAVSSELLMRQLLKLDTVDAEGEARLQRKAEVRRVQNFHEILDNLKAKNSKPFSNSGNAVSVTTEWETFDSGIESSRPPPSMPSSTRITQDWERFD